MSKTIEAISEVLTVKPTDITVDTTENPRTSTDPEKYEELKGSIKQEGIFTPLLVRKNGDGYQLVAGFRRWHIASELGLDAIPVAVLDEKRDTFLTSVSENLQRENFTIGDEARIVTRLLAQPNATHKKVAKLMQRSEQWVSQRALLGQLGDEGHRAIAAGLPARLALVVLRSIGELPELCEALFKMLAYDIANEEEETVVWPDDAQFLRGLPSTITMLQDREDELALDLPFFWCAWHQSMLELELGNEKVDTLTQQLLDSTQSWERKQLGLGWSQEDIDAARAFDCLVMFEVPNQYNGFVSAYGIFTDLTWLQDRVVQKEGEFKKALAKVKRAMKAKEKAKTEQGNLGGKKEPGVEKPDPAVVAEEMWSACNFNHDLWAKGLNKLGKAKLTKGAADVLLTNVSRHDLWSQLDKTMMLVVPDHLEDGEAKRPKLAKDVVHGQARDWCGKGTSGEERMMRLVFLLGLSQCFDGRVVGQARRPRLWMHKEELPALQATLKGIIAPAGWERNGFKPAPMY